MSNTVKSLCASQLFCMLLTVQVVLRSVGWKQGASVECSGLCEDGGTAVSDFSLLGQIIPYNKFLCCGSFSITLAASAIPRNAAVLLSYSMTVSHSA